MVRESELVRVTEIVRRETDMVRNRACYPSTYILRLLLPSSIPLHFILLFHSLANPSSSSFSADLSRSSFLSLLFPAVFLTLNHLALSPSVSSFQSDSFIHLKCTYKYKLFLHTFFPSLSLFLRFIIMLLLMQGQFFTLISVICIIHFWSVKTYSFSLYSLKNWWWFKLDQGFRIIYPMVLYSPSFCARESQLRAVFIKIPCLLLFPMLCASSNLSFSPESHSSSTFESISFFLRVSFSLPPSHSSSNGAATTPFPLGISSRPIDSGLDMRKKRDCGKTCAVESVCQRENEREEGRERICVYFVGFNRTKEGRREIECRPDVIWAQAKQGRPLGSEVLKASTTTLTHRKRPSCAFRQLFTRQR